MVFAWVFKGSLGEEFGGKLGKNFLFLERVVGETFMNQWKNIYPWLELNQKTGLNQVLKIKTNNNGIFLAF